MTIDKKDREILQLLQADASLSLAEIASAVNLTQTPCWRRIQKLQADGVIQKQVALCDSKKLNLGLTTFVSIRTSQHNEQWMQRFVAGATSIAEIVEI
jgi:Lrp/AsnC family transcriptional regulator